MTIKSWRPNATTVFLLATSLALIVGLLVKAHYQQNKCMGIGYPAEIHNDLNNATPWPISRLVLFGKKQVGVIFDSLEDSDLRVKVLLNESDTTIRVGLLIEGAKARINIPSRKPGSRIYVGGTLRYASVNLTSPIGTRALLMTPLPHSSTSTHRWPLQSYVGLSEKKATERADNEYRKYRKIHLDRIPEWVTMDFRTNFFISDKQGVPTVVGVSHDSGESAGVVPDDYCYP